MNVFVDATPHQRGWASEDVGLDSKVSYLVRPLKCESFRRDEDDDKKRSFGALLQAGNCDQ